MRYRGCWFRKLIEPDGASQAMVKAEHRTQQEGGCVDSGKHSRLCWLKFTLCMCWASLLAELSLLGYVMQYSHVRTFKAGMVIRACNLSTQEVKEGRMGVQGQPQQFSKFSTNLDFVRLHLKTNEDTRSPKKRRFKNYVLWAALVTFKQLWSSFLKWAAVASGHSLQAQSVPCCHCAPTSPILRSPLRLFFII